MTKAEKKAKLKEAGLEDSVIEEMIAGEDNTAKIAALEAKIAEAEGKAGGILADKKKFQQKVDELQSKLDELEGKGLGEAEKLKLEMSRMQAKLDKAEKDKTDLESSYKTEKRNAELGKIAQKLKFLDSVPDDTRTLLISNELKDLEDLGNTVLVEERLKVVSEKYAGLLAADVPNGAGSRAGGNQTKPNRNGIDKVMAMSDDDILKDPANALRMASQT